MMASTFNQTNEACQVTKLRRWHVIAWSMESMLWKAFPMQLRWSTRCLGFSRQRCLDCLDWRKNARLPVAEHASDEGKTPCTCLTRYASGLSLFDIPLRHCSCPKVWSQSVASKTWQHTDSSDDLLGFQSSQPTPLQYIRCIGVGHAKGIEKTRIFKQTPRAFAQIWARPRLWSSGTWHLEESGKVHHDHFRGSWVETALGRYKAPQAHNLQSLANTQVSACRSQWWQRLRLKSKCNSGRMMLVHHESEKGSDQNTGLKNWISWGIELLKASDKALGDYTESKMSLSSSHLCCFLASST